MPVSERIIIYTIEDDDDVHLTFGGVEIVVATANSPAAIALLKLDAECRAEAASPLMPVPGWQPIETAPKNGLPILVGHAQAVFDAWWSEDAAGWTDGSTDNYDDPVTFKPTHWMPLPRPPQHEEADRA